MKKLLLPLLVMLCFAAQAQIPGGTIVNARYKWLGAWFDAAIMPAYCDTSQYPSWVPRKGGHHMLDTCGADKGTLYVKYDGYWHPIVGSGGGPVDTTGYGYFAAQPPLILTPDGDTAVLSIDTTVLNGSRTLQPYSLRANNITTRDGLLSVIAQNGGQPRVILLDTAVSILVNTTIPSNISILPAGGYFNIVGGTLTQNGPLIDAPSKRFIYGDGLYRAPASVVSIWKPEWFGAVTGDGVADDSAYVKAAAAANATNGSKVVGLQSGIYHTAAGWVVAGDQKLFGSVWKATSINALAGGINVVTINSRSFVADLSINGADLALNGMVVANGNKAAVNNVIIQRNLGVGFLVNVMNNAVFYNVTSEYNGVARNNHIL